jgi:hypothetical protein
VRRLVFGALLAFLHLFKLRLLRGLNVRNRENQTDADPIQKKQESQSISEHIEHNIFYARLVAKLAHDADFVVSCDILHL